MTDFNFDYTENENNEIVTPEVVETDTYDSNYYTKPLVIYFITVYALSLFVQMALILIYEIIFKTDPTFIGPNGDQLYTDHASNFLNLWTQISTYFILLIIVIVLLHKDLVKDFFKTKANIKSVLKDVIVGFILLYVASILANAVLIVLNITRASNNQSDIENMIFNCSNIELILFSIILVIVTPLIEELIFRKSLFGFLKKYNFSSQKTILVSALFFGGIHVFASILSLIISSAPFMEILTEFLLIIPYFAMGYVLSYCYEKSNRNIFVPTLIHVSNNLLSLILILFFPTI